MSETGLEEAYQEFTNDLLIEADVSGDSQHNCFFRLFSDVASQNGDTSDLDYTPARIDGRGGYQVDGYALDLDRGELFVAVCAFYSENEMQSLNAAGMESYFRRVDSFIEKAVEPEFIEQLDETSPAFDAAYPIYAHRNQIKRIRVILLTNAALAVRKKIVEAGEILKKSVAYNVLDFARYVDILRSRGNAEPVEVDVSELNGGPLPCLRAHMPGNDYESYLVVLPGKFLAEIYGLYGARLLEQNVRVFLQARTKVNRGIIDTIRDKPEMFFAYNNGLTATAAGIELEEISDGMFGISSIRNLQIVNGGQTTASILYARDQSRSDLDDVFVQMKLSVIRPERVEEIVPKISRFANTQNRISEADFFSSHPFHVEMEKISRRVSAPAKAGTLAPTKWFYERARGQYRDAGAYGTPSERRRFTAEYPKNQVINKTDLAKYEATFECEPHLVSRGAQKCFLEFAEKVSISWGKKADDFNEGYFRNAMARAIVFRETDKLVGYSDWYRADRGYKANIVTYSIAWLVHHLKTEHETALDLQLIWNRQELPEELSDTIMEVARKVAETIKNTPETARNVTEYAKQQQCWARILQLKLPLAPGLKDLTKSLAEVKAAERADKSAGRLHKEIDFETDLVHLQPRVLEIREFARSKKMLSPLSSKALEKVEKFNLNLTKSEKNALKYLFKSMEERGFDLRVSEESV
jgi:hypothetical protein